MSPATPPTADLSRPKLKQLSAWIRNDLDAMIAQEGPEKLQADDVLTLHEAFYALRTSNSITALDLRATGIHRAVLEVAGTATRWPRRLVDDCDKIIAVWTSKFGRLQDLHPFMYGRGGRLEGIASIDEFSRGALLKRWQATCPDKMSPKRSRRHGDLGFKPGSWWMNPLFAYHAGIIDLESSEGGICFDKRGAYAVVLRDCKEIESTSQSNFTYRCAQSDKGKFRLTSADVKSRYPIRVLRCHTLNSVWAPKAGIRYDGIYRTVGWCIRTAKADDSIGNQFNEGDFIHEVHFDRIDQTPMEEVLKHPNTCELDDYAEYKRLRRLHREEHRKGPTAHQAHVDLQAPTKAAPPVPPPTTIVSKVQASKPSPSPSRTTTFKDPLVTVRLGSNLQASPSAHSVTKPSPASTTASVSGEGISSSELPRVTLDVPTHSTKTRPNAHGSISDSPHSDLNHTLQRMYSAASSKHSGQSKHSDIREVVPWIDHDLELVAAAPSINARPSIQQIDALARSKTRRKSRANMSAGAAPLDSPVTPTSEVEKQTQTQIQTQMQKTKSSGKHKVLGKVLPHIPREDSRLQR